MSGKYPVWEKVESFRRDHFAEQLATLPVDVFTAAELNCGWTLQ